MELRKRIVKKTVLSKILRMMVVNLTQRNSKRSWRGRETTIGRTIQMLLTFQATLTKYRSFHNHDLDTNYVEHAHLVMDEELHKRVSVEKRYLKRVNYQKCLSNSTKLQQFRQFTNSTSLVLTKTTNK